MTALLIVAVAAAGELPRTKPLEQHPGIETVAGTLEGRGGDGCGPSRPLRLEQDGCCRCSWLAG